MRIHKKWIGFFIGIIILAGLVGYPLNAYLKQRAEQRAEKERWVAAVKAEEDRFDTLCKTKAVYKIYKVVKNVDAIQLLKIRQKGDWSDQMEPGAALALEGDGDDYIEGFLMYEEPSHIPGKIITLSPKKRGGFYTLPEDAHKEVGEEQTSPGYKYVDIYEEGVRYRVTGSKKVVGKANSSAYGIQQELKRNPNFDLNIYKWSLDRIIDNDPPPRYAVTFEDYVIPEERAHGLASSRIVVLDTQTNEVLGEVTVYAWGGPRGSGGSWQNTYSCPGNPEDSMHTTRPFVDQVLMPTGSVYSNID